MSKNQFIGTATQPRCNRKFCQFNNDQYCTVSKLFINVTCVYTIYISYIKIFNL